MSKKFRENDLVFYLNPFSFHIDKVVLEFYEELEQGVPGWIDSTYAYLNEDDLFNDFEAAKRECVRRFNEFYMRRMREIVSVEEEDVQMASDGLDYYDGEMNEFNNPENMEE